MKKIRLRLMGPEGNAFNLLGYAEYFAEKTGKDPKAITQEMQKGDYDNLVAVFKREFGHFVELAE